MFPPKATRHSMIVTNVKDSEAPLMRFKRPRLNLTNNNDTGNSVMTESQVKAKLEKKYQHQASIVCLWRRRKIRKMTYTFEMIWRFAPTLAYRTPLKRVKTQMVTACAFVAGMRRKNSWGRILSCANFSNKAQALRMPVNSVRCRRLSDEKELHYIPVKTPALRTMLASTTTQMRIHLPTD